MTGSPACRCTRIRGLVGRRQSLVHRFHPARDPSYGRDMVLNSTAEVGLITVRFNLRLPVRRLAVLKPVAHCRCRSECMRCVEYRGKGVSEGWCEGAGRLGFVRTPLGGELVVF